MNRLLSAGVVLTVGGFCLISISLFLIPIPEATYYIQADAVEEVSENATVLDLADVDDSIRPEVKQSITSGSHVEVESDPLDVHRYVRHEEQVYQLIVAVGDPIGGGLFHLSLLALGFLAILAATGTIGFGLWRRYAW